MGQRRSLTIARGMLAIAAVSVLAACVEPPVDPPPPDPPPPPPPVAQLADPPPALASAPTGSPTLTETVVLDDLTSQIWDFAFAPDGRVLLSLRETGVAVFAVGDTQPTTLRVVDDLWVTGAESGALGLALHPDFATNRYLYLCYTTQTPTRKVRLFRYTVNAEYTALTDDVELLPGGIDTGDAHHGCRVAFQPGTSPPALFVTVGDGYFVGTPASIPQDMTRLAGKVLRLTDTGEAYPGNPFGTRVYTYGHRNPQGLAFAESGRVYTSEHGPDVNDEVNLLAAGGNGGWDGGPLYNQQVPMTDIVTYPDAMRPVWRSGDSSTLAPSGMAVLADDAWGPWQDALVVTFLKGRQLVVMFRDASGAVTGTWSEAAVGDASAAENGGRYPRLRAAELDADGNLWVATDHPYDNPFNPSWSDTRPGQLLKLTPVLPAP